MSDITVAPGGGAEPIPAAPVVTPAIPDKTPISVTEAARQLRNWRANRDNPPSPAKETPITKEPAAPPEAAAAPATEIDAAPQDDAEPGDTAEAIEPAAEELPIVEPPRSWTKAEKEEFATYPHDAQEKIARREQERDTAIRRSQNEAAETRKALEAERGTVEQARQRYEQALPALLQTLQEQQQGEFSDIKTMSDVEKLAREDWPRYALWDAQQKKIAAVAQEVQAAQQRQATEYESQWNAYAAKQDALLLERVPDLADKAKAQKLANGAAEAYRDAGFDEKELASLWQGKGSVSLRDARLSQIAIKAARYDTIMANAAKAPAKPNLPPVQRPGTSKPTTRGDDELLALEKRFERTGSIKDATALRLARMRARA